MNVSPHSLKHQTRSAARQVDLDPEQMEGRRRRVCLWFGNCIQLCFICLECGHEHGMTVARPQQNQCWWLRKLAFAGFDLLGCRSTCFLRSMPTPRSLASCKHAIKASALHTSPLHVSKRHLHLQSRTVG